MQERTLNFTLPTIKQHREAEYLLGNENGPCRPCDLAVLLGSWCNNKANGLNVRCASWVSDFYDCEYAYLIRSDGADSRDSPRRRTPALRPVLPVSEVAKIRKYAVKTQEGSYFFGMYPQNVTQNAGIWHVDERKYAFVQGQKLGYTFDANDGSDLYNCGRKFEPMFSPVYDYKGKKYICVRARPEDNDCRLPSTGDKVLRGRTYKVEIKPVRFIELSDGCWICAAALTAGIRWTDAGLFLNTYFSKEIVQYNHENVKQMLGQVRNVRNLAPDRF